MSINISIKRDKVTYLCVICQKPHNPATQKPHIIRLLIGFQPVENKLFPAFHSGTMTCPDCFKKHTRKGNLVPMQDVFPEVIEEEKKLTMKQPAGNKEAIAMADIPEGGLIHKKGK